MSKPALGFMVVRSKTRWMGKTKSDLSKGDFGGQPLPVVKDYYLSAPFGNALNDGDILEAVWTPAGGLQLMFSHIDVPPEILDAVRNGISTYESAKAAA